MSAPKTDTELADGYRAFINDIMKRFDHPENIPLSLDAQVDFVKWVGWRAKELRDSEPFLRGEIVKTVGEYVQATRTGKTLSKTKTK